jgi:hypothetical protein
MVFLKCIELNLNERWNLNYTFKFLHMRYFKGKLHFECGLHLMMCFQRIEYGKAKIVTVRGRNMAHATLAKWQRLTSPVTVVLITCPLVYREKDISPRKTHNPSLSMRKTSDKPKLRDIAKYMVTNPQNHQCHETRKDWALVTTRVVTRRCDDYLQCSSLDWVLSQKEDREKPVKIK